MNLLCDNKSLVNGMLFSMFSFINKGFIFLLLLILANYINPKEYGYLSLFVTVLMVISYIIALSTEGYLSVSYFKDKREGTRQTFTDIMLISITILTLLIIVLFLGGTKISQLLQLPLDILYIAVGICFFTLIFNLYIDYARLQDRVKFYGIMSCSNALLNFVLSILMVKTLLFGWQGRVYAQFICFIVYGSFGLYFFTSKNFWVKPNFKSLKRLIIWGLPVIPHLAANFIRQGCDRYIISYSHSITDVGLFSFALNIANIVIMIGIGFNQSNSVDIYKILGDTDSTPNEKRQKLVRQRILIQRVYFLLTLIVMICGYLIFPIILPKYAGAMNYFLILAIWGFFQCLYFLYTNYLFYYNKTKQIMYVTFGTSLVHLGLSLILTKYSLYYTCLIYVLIQFLIFILIRRIAVKTVELNNI